MRIHCPAGTWYWKIARQGVLQKMWGITKFLIPLGWLNPNRSELFQPEANQICAQNFWLCSKMYSSFIELSLVHCHYASVCLCLLSLFPSISCSVLPLQGGGRTQHHRRRRSTEPLMLRLRHPLDGFQKISQTAHKTRHAGQGVPSLQPIVESLRCRRHPPPPPTPGSQDSPKLISYLFRSETLLQSSRVSFDLHNMYSLLSCSVNNSFGFWQEIHSVSLFGPKFRGNCTSSVPWNLSLRPTFKQSEVEKRNVAPRDVAMPSSVFVVMFRVFAVSALLHTALPSVPESSSASQAFCEISRCAMGAATSGGADMAIFRGLQWVSHS